jgi:type IX secretion system PorP/SprF family membrane protein
MNLSYTIKTVVLLTIFLFTQHNVGAQQLPFLIQNENTFNPSFINGDYMKYDLPTQAGMRYRYQWAGVEGAPNTMNAYFSNWNEDYNFLVGANFINDQTGPTSFTGAYGKAAYGIQAGRDVLISVGLTGGIVQYRINGDKLNFLEPGELNNGAVTKIFPDFGGGATVYLNQKYYFGVNIPQVFGLNLDFRDEQNSVSTKRVRHYYAIAGSYLELYDGSFLEPSVEVRYVENIPLLISARLRYNYQETFWVGLHGTSSKAAGLDVGLMWDTGDNILKFGYAFTNFFQQYGPNFGSTHELGLSVSW